MTRKMHLLLFPSGAGAHVAAWRHPLGEPGRRQDMAHYRRLAALAERGKFDGMFFADAQGYRTVVGRDAFSRMGAGGLEPVTLLAALSAVTSKLGLIGTVSTTYNEPYSVARRMATLDHVSGGRAGWNVVTSATQNEAHNFGRDEQVEHDQRYARAAEFVEVVKALWDSWDEDALVIDPDSGRFFDPDKVHGLNHRGDFFSVAGPLNVMRPPQGHPVIFQAGASPAGRHLAAHTAEVVFTTQPTLESAQALYSTLKAAVRAAGRAEDSCKITPAIQPLIADTEAQARQIEAELNALIPLDLAISLLQMQLGTVDLSACDPDGPLPPIPLTQGGQTIQSRVVEIAEREALSIAQLARRIAADRTSKSIVGTPEQVADTLETWFRSRGGDGFVITAPILPDMMERFVDGVVPILQQRGLFREDYEGDTLREHLGLARPPSRYAAGDLPYVEPEIWQPD